MRPATMNATRGNLSLGVKRQQTIKACGFALSMMALVDEEHVPQRDLKPLLLSLTRSQHLEKVSGAARRVLIQKDRGLLVVRD